MKITVDLSDADLQVMERWKDQYLSSDMPPTPEGIVRDLLRRISDDMVEMAEQADSGCTCGRGEENPGHSPACNISG